MRLRTLLGLVAGFIIASPASAQLLAGSTFDNGDEGWRVGNYAQLSGNAVPQFFAAGGNPGGYIHTEDLFFWTSWHAPAAFLGNKSAAYGGTLSFDLRNVFSDGTNYPAAVLSDGNIILYNLAFIPGTDWTSYQLNLLPGNGWRVTNFLLQNLGAASGAQMQQVLGNLTMLHINADWATGDDRFDLPVDLDNVYLRGPNRAPGVPEPGTLALLVGSSVVGVLAVRRRR